MRPFVCELLACRPDGDADLAETRVFVAPNLTVAIDQAKQWASMEPWIGAPGTMMRLLTEGRPVWTRGLSRPQVVRSQVVRMRQTA
jgi:hypothetical protein